MSVRQFPVPTFSPRFDSSAKIPKITAGRTPVSADASFAYSYALPNGIAPESRRSKRRARISVAVLVCAAITDWYTFSCPFAAVTSPCFSSSFSSSDLFWKTWSCFISCSSSCSLASAFLRSERSARATAMTLNAASSAFCTDSNSSISVNMSEMLLPSAISAIEMSSISRVRRIICATDSWPLATLPSSTLIADSLSFMPSVSFLIVRSRCLIASCEALISPSMIATSRSSVCRSPCFFESSFLLALICVSSSPSCFSNSARSSGVSAAKAEKGRRRNATKRVLTRTKRIRELYPGGAGEAKIQYEDGKKAAALQGRRLFDFMITSPPSFLPPPHLPQPPRPPSALRRLPQV